MEEFNAFSYYFHGNGEVPLTVTFKTKYEYHGEEANLIKWDFGDGVTSEGEEVEHTYTTAGDYMVKLDVYLKTDDGEELLAMYDDRIVTTSPDSSQHVSES